MSDNDIIKALKCCNKYKGKPECIWAKEKCPYFPKSPCKTHLMQDALNLINRQKAEIERLQKALNTDFCFVGTRCSGKAKRVNEIIKFRVETIKAEAIKEFAERLKENTIDIDVSFGYGREHYTEAVTVIEIDNLVKEMMEQNHESK